MPKKYPYKLRRILVRPFEADYVFMQQILKDTGVTPGEAIRNLIHLYCNRARAGGNREIDEALTSLSDLEDEIDVDLEEDTQQ